MKRLLLRLHGYHDVLGWYGIVGASLLICSVIFYVTGVIPGVSQATHMNEAATQMQHVRHTPTPESIRKVNINDNLHDIYQQFPSEDEVAEILSKIYSMAEDSSLILERGQYKVVRDKTGQFSRYEMEFPVKGQYTEIQLFISGVLNTIPAMALNQITFKREAVHDTTVQSKLFFTLYMLNN